MKKLLLVGILVGIGGLVHATTINAPSSLVGFESLDGNNAYSWGISIAVPAGQQIVSAEVDWTGVTLNIANSSGTGVLYTDAPGDYWLGHQGAGLTALNTQTFNLGQTKSWTVVFTQPEINALNSYLAGNNGLFAIGIDPDCHYSVNGLSFTYNFGPTPRVPDFATTAFLMLMGLAGLEVFRRQFVTAKVKA